MKKGGELLIANGGEGLPEAGWGGDGLVLGLLVTAVIACGVSIVGEFGNSRLQKNFINPEFTLAYQSIWAVQIRQMRMMKGVNKPNRKAAMAIGIIRSASEIAIGTSVLIFTCCHCAISGEGKNGRFATTDTPLLENHAR